MDKFVAYYNTPERLEELSDYVHLNFHLIQTKMVSEMRRKLNITPDLENSDGYGSLSASLYFRMFNEIMYGMAGMCQAFDLKFNEVVAPSTMEILFMLMKGENPLGGKLRTDLNHISQERRNTYYLTYIDELRKNLEALPK